MCVWRIGWAGGGIFAKTAKTPPLQSALRGWHCVSHCDPGDINRKATCHVGKGGHSGVGGQLSGRPYSTSPTESTIANLENW